MSRSLNARNYSPRVAQSGWIGYETWWNSITLEGPKLNFPPRCKHLQICFNPKHGAGFGDKTGRWGVSNAAHLAFSSRKHRWIFWSTETTWADLGDEAPSAESWERSGHFHPRS